MAPPIIRTLISLSLNRSSHFQKPFSGCSISVLFFSSSATSLESLPSHSLVDHFIKKHNFSPQLALKAASSLISPRHIDNCDSVISFLKESGFSKSQIEVAVKRKPGILSSKIEKTIKPKFKIFRDLGCSTQDIADIISGDPWILTRSVDDRIAPSISHIKSVVGSNANVVKLLKTSAWFLLSDTQKTMMPSIEFMRSCGISSLQIVRYLFSFPRFFLHKPESIKQFAKRAEEMGFSRKSNMFLPAIRTLSSMSEKNWELKLELFRRLGFSEEDILSTFRMKPQVFAVSERKIKNVTEFLLSKKNIDISFIVNHPEVLICSVEHRLKPRLMVFDFLESKNLLSRKISLATLFKISEKRFRGKYVFPYLEELKKASVAVAGL